MTGQPWSMSDETLAEILMYCMDDLQSGKSRQELIRDMQRAYTLGRSEAERVVDMAIRMTKVD